LLYHRRGYALISNNKVFLEKIADHLIFLALTENFREATALVEKHYPWIEKNRDALYHFRFFRAAWLFFDLLAEQHERTFKLSLPRSFPLYAESGRYDASRLAAWFKGKAEEIARRFDERNETDFFSRTLNETPALKKLRAHFPLREAESIGEG
jgi:hypothetical protein